MRICFLLLLLILSTSAYGEIYRWRDNSGVTHYASSMDDVPLRYRARVKAMNYGPDPKGDAAVSGAAPSSVTSTSMSAPLAPAAGGGSETAQSGSHPRRMKRGGKRSPAAAGEEE